jgi:sulfur carrier protein
VRLIVNGDIQATADQLTLSELVRGVSDRESGIAVAVNSEVVPRSMWLTTALRDGDRVDVVTAVQGG